VGLAAGIILRRGGGEGGGGEGEEGAFRPSLKGYPESIYLD